MSLFTERAMGANVIFSQEWWEQFALLKSDSLQIRSFMFLLFLCPKQKSELLFVVKEGIALVALLKRAQERYALVTLLLSKSE